MSCPESIGAVGRCQDGQMKCNCDRISLDKRGIPVDMGNGSGSVSVSVLHLVTVPLRAGIFVA